MLKLFFGNHVPDSINLEYLKRFKVSRLKSISELNDIKQKLEKDPKKDTFWHYRMQTIIRGNLLLQADVDWCNTTIEYLKTSMVDCTNA